MSKYYNNLENEQLYHAQKVADALEFIEARMDGYLVHSDEYTSIDEAWDSALMHYGVLGMKWRKHLFENAAQNEKDRMNGKKLSIKSKLLNKIADRVAESDNKHNRSYLSTSLKVADKLGASKNKKISKFGINQINKLGSKIEGNKKDIGREVLSGTKKVPVIGKFKPDPNGKGIVPVTTPATYEFRSRDDAATNARKYYQTQKNEADIWDYKKKEQDYKKK